jgi:hypothetical protein
MKRKFRITKLGCAVLSALMLQAFALTSPVLAQTPEQTYKNVKEIEGLVKFPSVYGKKKVGVLDAVTGKFTYASPEYKTVHVDVGGGNPDEKPYHKPEKPEVNVGKMLINAVDVGLVFEVVNRKGDFSVTAGGKTVTAPANANSITIDVGRVAKVTWKVQSESKTHSDQLQIVRPPIVGAGAFTVPAVPVAVLYEPPMDKKKLNQATYVKTKVIGTTIKTGYGFESSETTPSNASEFIGAMNFKSEAAKYGGAISKIPNGYTQAIGKILEFLAAGMGSASASLQTGTSVTSEKALILSTGQTSQFGTGAKLGPGLGDRIIYLKNARLAWLGGMQGVRIGLLSYEKLDTRIVKILKEDWDYLVLNNFHLGGSANTNGNGPKLGPKTGLDAATLLALLKLDPMAHKGPNAPLDEKRFAYVDTYGVNGADDYHTFRQMITSADLQAKTSFRVKTEEYSSGFLSFMGLGVTETKKLMTKFSMGSSQEMSSSQMEEVTANFHAEADEIYDVKVFYDRIFRTFAFQPVPSGPTWLSGRALMANGQPMAKQIVSVTVGGKKFSTRTDAQGRYSFRASNIADGNGELVIGNIKKNVRIQKSTPIRNLELRQSQ